MARHNSNAIPKPNPPARKRLPDAVTMARDVIFSQTQHFEKMAQLAGDRETRAEFDTLARALRMGGTELIKRIAIEGVRA